MAGNKNLFKSFEDFNGGKIQFGDNSTGTVIGIGTILFNESCDITNVYLVKGLKYNFLIISKVCDLELEDRFKRTRCIIKDNTRKAILPCSRDKNVYILESVQGAKEYICLSSISENLWIWYKYIGHASMRLIETLPRHELVLGLP